MNIRTTFALVGALILVIIISVVYANTRNDTPKQVRVPQTFFYQIDSNALLRFSVTNKGKTEKFLVENNTWRFDGGANDPVNLTRWGGVTLLLSGPQYKRRLIQSAQPQDLQAYGLAEPDTTIKATLAQVGDIQILLGDKTADGSSHYVQFKSDTTSDTGIYLIDSSWGDIFSRLVTDPPHIPAPTPTPTPEPSAAATARP